MIGGALVLFAASGILGVVLEMVDDDTAVIAPTFRALDLNREGNLPTMYSAGLLLCAATLALVLAWMTRRPSWMVATAALLATVVDEIVQIHEWVAHQVADLLDIDGFRNYSWTLLALVSLAIVGWPLLRFLRSLSSPARTYAIAAIGIYLSGAVGLEIVGGLIDAATDDGNPASLRAVIQFEELAEMIGASLMSVALAQLIVTDQGGLRITLGSSTGVGSSAPTGR